MEHWRWPVIISDKPRPCASFCSLSLRQSGELLCRQTRKWKSDSRVNSSNLSQMFLSCADQVGSPRWALPAKSDTVLFLPVTTEPRKAPVFDTTVRTHKHFRTKTTFRQGRWILSLHRAFKSRTYRPGVSAELRFVLDPSSLCHSAIPRNLRLLLLSNLLTRRGWAICSF